MTKKPSWHAALPTKSTKTLTEQYHEQQPLPQFQKAPAQPRPPEERTLIQYALDTYQFPILWAVTLPTCGRKP